jgi:hypothetical protein
MYEYRQAVLAVLGYYKLRDSSLHGFITIFDFTLLFMSFVNSTSTLMLKNKLLFIILDILAENLLFILKNWLIEGKCTERFTVHYSSSYI